MDTRINLALEILRDLGRHKFQVILVLSMHDEAQMAARALKVGAAGYAGDYADPQTFQLSDNDLGAIECGHG